MMFRFFGCVFPVLLVIISEMTCSAEENDEKKVSPFVENCKNDASKVRQDIYEALKGDSVTDIEDNCNKYKDIYKRCNMAVLLSDAVSGKGIKQDNFEMICSSNQLRQMLRGEIRLSKSPSLHLSSIRFSILASALVVFFFTFILGDF